jgi:hypothetical protein
LFVVAAGSSAGKGVVRSGARGTCGGGAVVVTGGTSAAIGGGLATTGGVVVTGGDGSDNTGGVWVLVVSCAKSGVGRNAAAANNAAILWLLGAGSCFMTLQQPSPPMVTRAAPKRPRVPANGSVEVEASGSRAPLTRSLPAPRYAPSPQPIGTGRAVAQRVQRIDRLGFSRR